MLSQIFSTRNSNEQLLAVNPVLKGYLSSDNLTKISSLKILPSLYQSDIDGIIYNTLSKGCFNKNQITKKTSLLSLYQFMKLAKVSVYIGDVNKILENDFLEKSDVGALSFVLYDVLNEGLIEEELFKRYFRRVVENFEFYSIQSMCSVMKVLNKHIYVYLSKCDQEYRLVVESYIKLLSLQSYTVIIEIFSFLLNFKEYDKIIERFSVFLLYERETKEIQLEVLKFLCILLDKAEIKKNSLYRHVKWFFPKHNDSNELNIAKITILRHLLHEENHLKVLDRIHGYLYSNNTDMRQCMVELLKTLVMSFKLDKKLIDDKILKLNDTGFDSTRIHLICALLPYLQEKESYMKLLTDKLVISDPIIFERITSVFIEYLAEYQKEIVEWVTQIDESIDFQDISLNLKLINFSLKLLKKLSLDEGNDCDELKSLVYKRIVNISFRENDLSVFFKFILESVLENENLNQDRFFEILLKDIKLDRESSFEDCKEEEEYAIYGSFDKEHQRDLQKHITKQRRLYIEKNKVKEVKDNTEEDENSTMLLSSITN